MTLDVRLLAIAGPPVVDLARLVEQCRSAEAGGVTALQVRVKDVPAQELLRLTERLVETVRVPVYVNDRADVAWAAGAAGVHLGADDVPPAAIRRAAAPPFRIGVSVGTPAEASVMRHADVDYWSIGSVFATTTKPDAGRPIGVAGFTDLARAAPEGMPVIAIGGITPDNAAAVFAAGAAGIAVSSAVFGASDVEARAAALRKVVDAAIGSRR
jgi:thiamine-phosphate pyrophosphorylase